MDRLANDEVQEWIECGTCLVDLRHTAGPVQQCPHGHLQCSKCFVLLGGPTAECPSCGRPMGSIRNRLAENLRDVVQSVHMPGTEHRAGERAPEPVVQSQAYEKSAAMAIPCSTHGKVFALIFMCVLYSANRLQ